MGGGGVQMGGQMMGGQMMGGQMMGGQMMGGGMQMGGGMMMGGQLRGGMQGMMPGMMPGGGLMMGGGMMGGGGMQMMGCHPGCFPAGTLVQTSGCPRAGSRPSKSANLFSAWTKKGKTVAAKVHSAFVTDNYLVEVETDSGRLITSPASSLFAWLAGCTKTANELVPGDEMLSWEDGVVAAPRKVRRDQQDRAIGASFSIWSLRTRISTSPAGLQVRSKPPFADVASIAVVPEIDEAKFPSESTRE